MLKPGFVVSEDAQTQKYMKARTHMQGRSRRRAHTCIGAVAYVHTQPAQLAGLSHALAVPLQTPKSTVLF